jgi:hypothetical protein
MGIKVNAVNSEAKRAKEITKAISLNIIPVTPPTKIMGTNMAMVVKVEATTARPISEAPKIDPSWDRSPFSL